MNAFEKKFVLPRVVWSKKWEVSGWVFPVKVEHKVHSLSRKACAWNLILAFEVFFTAMLIEPYQINWKNQMCFSSPTVAALQHSSPKLTPSFVWHKTHTAEKNGHTSTSFFETDIPNLWLLIMKCASWSAVVDLCNGWLLSTSSLLRPRVHAQEPSRSVWVRRLRSCSHYHKK